MWAGIRVWGRGLRHLNHRGYIYIWANVLWLLLSLPLVTAPAAWAGLMKMSYLAHRGPSADIHDLWEGFKENLKRGLLLTLLNVLIVGLNVSNLVAYMEAPGVFYAALRVIWLLLLLVWFTIQLYLWPLFYEMEQPRLWGALRNAAVMLILNPLFTLGLWLVLIPVILLSTALPAFWFLLTGSMLAAAANQAVLDRLQAAGLRKLNLPDETLDV
ncbi:MAG: DUF624 domain-containing protein [Chloroflexi bacterium]|nr:DUF624 domain-containing protein [Chloroflexota bacterium]